MTAVALNGSDGFLGRISPQDPSKSHENSREKWRKKENKFIRFLAHRSPPFLEASPLCPCLGTGPTDCSLCSSATSRDKHDLKEE